MARQKYVIGSICNKGHLLTEETTYVRPQGNLVCRICKAKTDSEYRIKNQQKIQARQLLWSKTNPEKKWATARKNHLKRKYNIDQAEFDKLFTTQNGVCAICKEAPHVMDRCKKPHKLPLYVDHNHITGRVRGLLCWNCNLAIGHFKDNILALQEAINYLYETDASTATGKE